MSVDIDLDLFADNKTPGSIWVPGPDGLIPGLTIQGRQFLRGELPDPGTHTQVCRLIDLFGQFADKTFEFTVPEPGQPAASSMFHHTTFSTGNLTIDGGGEVTAVTKLGGTGIASVTGTNTGDGIILDAPNAALVFESTAHAGNRGSGAVLQFTAPATGELNLTFRIRNFNKDSGVAAFAGSSGGARFGWSGPTDTLAQLFSGYAGTAPQFYIDGTLFAGTTRQQLYDALKLAMPDGVLQITGLDATDASIAGLTFTLGGFGNDAFSHYLELLAFDVFSDNTQREASREWVNSL